MRFFAMAAAAAAVSLREQTEFDTGIIDALTPAKGNCEERLWMDQNELNWQIDQFSRKFDKKNYDNAATIAAGLGVAMPKVYSWELLNKSFKFPRIRRFETVQENMDLVEHFQDNLNLNLSNSVAVENFIRSAKAAVDNIADKYQDGEFANPADYDPRVEEEKWV